MTEKLLARFKQQISALELEPSSGGCFEISVDGELIYSKLQSGAFPREQEIVEQIERRLVSS